MSIPSPLSSRSPFPQKRGDPSPSRSSLAPPLADFPDFALLPPRQQGTRAACVMGAGNKDAQDPPPRPPGTSCPHLPELFARSSRSDSQRFLALHEPGRRALRVGHTHPATLRRKSGLRIWGKALSPENSARIHPNPHTPNQTRANRTPQPHHRSRAGAGHPRLPRASGRPGRTDTCWFSFLPTSPSPSQVPQTKQYREVTVLRLRGSLLEKREQVGASANSQACEERNGGIG